MVIDGESNRRSNLLLAVGAVVMFLLFVAGLLSGASVEIPFCLVAVFVFVLWARKEKSRLREMAQLKYQLGMLDPDDPAYPALRARYVALQNYYQPSNASRLQNYHGVTPPDGAQGGGDHGLGANSGNDGGGSGNSGG